MLSSGDGPVVPSLQVDCPWGSESWARNQLRIKTVSALLGICLIEWESVGESLSLDLTAKPGNEGETSLDTHSTKRGRGKMDRSGVGRRRRIRWWCWWWWGFHFGFLGSSSLASGTWSGRSSIGRAIPIHSSLHLLVIVIFIDVPAISIICEFVFVFVSVVFVFVCVFSFPFVHDVEDLFVRCEVFFDFPSSETSPSLHGNPTSNNVLLFGRNSLRTYVRTLVNLHP